MPSIKKKRKAVLATKVADPPQAANAGANNSNALLPLRIVVGAGESLHHPPCPRETGLSREERAYLADLPRREREELLRDLDAGRAEPPTPLRFRVARSALPQHSKAELMRRLKSGCEGGKLEHMCELALKLPFGRSSGGGEGERGGGREKGKGGDLGAFLSNARATMDAEIYGQDELKDHTVRALCSWATRDDCAGLALGLEGPAGVGKTSYARALGRIMGRPLCMISLGGMNDVAVLSGHSYTYESSTHGQLAQCLMDCGTNAPVVVLDEVDKLGDSVRARDIESLLIHLADPAANSEIRDRYFHPAQIALDFSRACFVFTMNDARRVSPILLDRLTMVRMEAPTPEDKAEIAKRYLIPRELGRLECAGLEFDEEAVRALVREHSSREAGVRQLARAVRRLVETLNVVRRGGARALQGVSAGEEEEATVSCATVERLLDRKKASNEQPPIAAMMMYS